MSDKKRLTMMIMDPPYESSNTTTAFRMIHSALNKGHDVSVFAFEGAVSLTMAGQKGHPNPVKGTSADEEKHPLTREWVAALFRLAESKGCDLEWVNCGFCVDERAAGDWIDGPKRGGPPNFHAMLQKSDAVIVVPSR